MPERAQGRGAPHRAERKGGDPKSVASSLTEAARLLGAEGALELSAVKRRWLEAVGPEVAAHCRPVSLRSGRLTLAVDHPAWASELRVLSGMLLSRIREVQPSVEAIVVQVSPRDGRGW
jgi:predicted nucleic acid-binding Zn ribbon protein